MVDQQQRAEQFLQLYSSCESQLFGYLMALLCNQSDAEEVFQESTLVLWRSFDDFEPGTSFLNWAKQVAFHRVLKFRRLRRRNGVPGSERFLETVQRRLAARSDILDCRLQALANCVRKLSEADRRLVVMRYESNYKVRDLAIELRKPVNTVYKSMRRIRHALADCVARSLSREEHV